VLIIGEGGDCAGVSGIVGSRIVANARNMSDAGVAVSLSKL
jgi:hypothetical protein